jgi:hypothetical protein
MKRTTVWLVAAVLAVALGIIFMGCATAPSGQAAAPPQSDLLTQAGFIVLTPKSPKIQAYVETLPAQKVVSNMYRGRRVYLVRTAPDSLQCFVGNQSSYNRYEQLALQQGISEERHKVQEQRFDPEALQLWAESQGAP